MKRLSLFFLLLAVFCLCLASCGGASETPSESESATSSESESGSESESESEHETAPRIYTVLALDGDGFAFPGLTVSFTVDGEEHTFVTDDDGCAYVCVECSLLPLTVRFLAPEGYVTDIPEYLLSETAFEITVTVTEAPKTKETYTVYAKDLMGNPVVGAPVKILDAEGREVTSGVTDEGGVFDVLLPIAEYVCTISSPDAARYQYTGAAELSFGEEKREVIANFVKLEQNEERDYTVTVRDMEEKPLSGVAVSIQKTEDGSEVARGVTEEEGVFVAHLPKGSYEAVITLPEGASGESRLSFGATTGASFLLTTGQVAVEESHWVYVKNHEGKALKGITVRVVSEGETLFEGVTNATGRVRVTFTAVNFYIVAEGANGYNSGLCFEFDEDGTGTVYLDPLPNGSEEFPLQLSETPYTTASVPEDGIVYYYIRYPGGKGVSLSEGGVIWYNGTKKTLGKDEYFAFTESALVESIILGIATADGGAGDVSFRVSGPLGSMDNPIPAGLEEYTVTVEKNQALIYSFTAPGDGVLIYTSSDPLNSASFSNLTRNFYGGGTNGARVTTMYVREGDEVILTATTVYNEQGGFSPAGSYSFTLSMAEGTPADPAIFDSEEADIFLGTEGSVVYAVREGSGKTLVFRNAPTLTCVANGETYTADAEGTVTVPLGADATVTLQNGAGYGKVYHAALEA